LGRQRSRVKREAAKAFAAALARPHNVPAQPSLGRPRILPSLRSAPTPSHPPPSSDIEFYEVAEGLECERWRVGWYWINWENPWREAGDPPYEGDGLPSRARGPFKTKGRAEQAVAVYLRAR